MPTLATKQIVWRLTWDPRTLCHVWPWLLYGRVETDLIQAACKKWQNSNRSTVWFNSIWTCLRSLENPENARIIWNSLHRLLSSAAWSLTPSPPTQIQRDALSTSSHNCMCSERLTTVHGTETQCFLFSTARHWSGLCCSASIYSKRNCSLPTIMRHATPSIYTNLNTHKQ